MDPEGGQGVWTPPPLKNHENIGFLCNTGLDPLKNNKATKTAFNVGPLLARQRDAISMAFPWQADEDPFIAVFGWSVPSSTKKQMLSNMDSRRQNFLYRRMILILCIHNEETLNICMKVFDIQENSLAFLTNTVNVLKFRTL